MAAVVALLAGCATKPPAPAPDRFAGSGIVYPDSLRSRITSIAEREWVLFGYPAVSYVQAVPEILHEGIGESAPDAFVSVLAYWSVLQPHDARWSGYIASQERAYRDGGIAVWSRTPWSAAFVSYVMLTAGIDPRDFTPNAAHAAYLNDAIARTDRLGARAVYEAMEYDAVRPSPGDLLCSDGLARDAATDDPQRLARRVASLAEFRELPAGVRRSRPLHCDIVWKIDADARLVYAIGGNVANGVAQSVFPLDGNGCVVRRYPPQAGDERTFFALLRLNTRTRTEAMPCNRP